MAVPYANEIIDLLLTVGHIDGFFHERERTFVHHYLDELVEKSAPKPAEPPGGTGMGIGMGIGMGMGIGISAVRGDERGEFDAVFEKLEREIAELATEVVPSTAGGFVPTRLKVRALTIFGGLPPDVRAHALELVRALIIADGVLAPPEHTLFEELSRYAAEARPVAPPNARTLLDAKPPVIGAPPAASPRAPSSRPVAVSLPLRLAPEASSHPLLDPLERAYAIDAGERAGQTAHDQALAVSAMARWEQMRAQGRGKLAGVADVGQLPVGARFLDGHVHVLRPDKPLELIVLGDLHGCYACLKAALLQSNFLPRALARKQDPRAPEVKLVFLGDYIDRGRFGFDGVLRAALTLFTQFPDDVIVLRGNHEHFLSFPGEVRSAVAPAETIASVGPHVPRMLLDTYRMLFEAMPTSFVVDRTLFVHGGIPRDDTFAAKYRDLGSLDEPEIRFQMMWSDPAQVDHVPVELQRQNPRFSFGRAQFDQFMQRAGFKTMIRGHDKIEGGFEIIFDGDPSLLNLFSAGGSDNADLPLGASYRAVTPFAMTIEHTPNGAIATPWPIEYQAFNHAPHNGFRRPIPTLPFTADH